MRIIGVVQVLIESADYLRLRRQVAPTVIVVVKLWWMAAFRPPATRVRRRVAQILVSDFDVELPPQTVATWHSGTVRTFFRAKDRHFRTEKSRRCTTLCTCAVLVPVSNIPRCIKWRQLDIQHMHQMLQPELHQGAVDCW
jgi:hypothetical protein